jgi:hypothetical protein
MTKKDEICKTCCNLQRIKRETSMKVIAFKN